MLGALWGGLGSGDQDGSGRIASRARVAAGSAVASDVGSRASTVMSPSSMVTSGRTRATAGPSEVSGCQEVASPKPGVFLFASLQSPA